MTSPPSPTPRQPEGDLRPGGAKAGRAAPAPTETFALHFEGTSQPLLLLDGDLASVRANAAFIGAFGAAPPSLGPGAPDWMRPLQRMARELASGTMVLSVAEVEQPAHPAPRVVRVTGRRIAPGPGHAALVALQFDDVTAERLERDLTSRRLDALVASEALLSGILDALTEGVVVAGADGTVIASNAAARGLLGETVALGAPWSQAEALLTDAEGAPATPLQPTADGADEAVRFAGAEAVAVRVLPLGAQVRGRAGGSVVVLRRIGPELQLRRELDRRMKDLERSNRDLEQFAELASHDLQEPLRMVTSYVQLLASRYRGRLDADADEFIGYANDGALRMRALIRDLLAYARVGGDQRPLVPVPLDRALDAALASLQSAIESSGAAVTRGPLPTIDAEETQVTQVFQNLIANAIKFSGGAPPKIHVGAQRSGGEWVVTVADEGIGIAPEFHERVFKLFQRLHGRSEYPGTGLGLAICRRVAERHGGRAWVESEAGHGSRFHVSFPGSRP